MLEKERSSGETTDKSISTRPLRKSSKKKRKSSGSIVEESVKKAKQESLLFSWDLDHPSNEFTSQEPPIDNVDLRNFSEMEAGAGLGDLNQININFDSEPKKEEAQGPPPECFSEEKSLEGMKNNQDVHFHQVNLHDLEDIHSEQLPIFGPFLPEKPMEENMEASEEGEKLYIGCELSQDAQREQLLPQFADQGTQDHSHQCGHEDENQVQVQEMALGFPYYHFNPKQNLLRRHSFHHLPSYSRAEEIQAEEKKEQEKKEEEEKQRKKLESLLDPNHEPVEDEGQKELPFYGPLLEHNLDPLSFDLNI